MRTNVRNQNVITDSASTINFVLKWMSKIYKIDDFGTFAGLW